MSFGDESIDFDVFMQGDLARIRFEFPSDSGAVRAEYQSLPATEGEGRTPPTVVLRFFNLHNVGSFTDGPVHLGTVGGNALWIVYEVKPATGSRHVKQIAYTLWEGPEQPGEGLLIGKYRLGS